jgi:hypothetical protein
MRLSGPARTPFLENVTIPDVAQLKGRLAGERCFIIGNGPSLRRTDLTLLRDEYTIGLNRIYLNYENMGYEPTLYCSVNPSVLEQFSGEIDRLKSIKFLNALSADHVRNRQNTFLMNSLDTGELIGFHEELETLEWWEGGTVTYCALQVAHYLGFDTVVLLGVDHHFTVTGEPNELVTAEAPDVNHFRPDYFGKGVKWQYPDLVRSEAAYKVARAVYRKGGREILDATVGGKLHVFPKVEYASLFGRDRTTVSRAKRLMRVVAYYVDTITRRTG